MSSVVGITFTFLGFAMLIANRQIAKFLNARRPLSKYSLPPPKVSEKISVWGVVFLMAGLFIWFAGPPIYGF